VLFNEYLFPYSLSDNPFLPTISSAPSPHVPFTNPLIVVSLSPSVTDISSVAHDNVTSNTLDNLSASTSPVFASSSHFSAGTVPSSSEPHPTSTNIHPMTTRAKAGIYKPKVLSTSTTQSDLEPTTYKQAMQQPPWLHAMKVEYVALLDNKTWTLTPLPPRANLFGCK